MKHLPRIFLLSLFGLMLAGRSNASIFSHSDTEEELTKKIAALPSDTKSKTRAGLLSDLATLDYHKGQMQKAVDNFKLALEAGARKAQKRHIFRFLGKSYEGVNQLDLAIEAYEQAVVYDKKNWRRHRDVAGLYERTELYPKAVTSYQSAIKYNAKETSLQVGLGRTWRKMGLSQEAEECLKKAQSMGDVSSALYEEFSMVYEQQGRFIESARSYQKTLTNHSTAKDWGRLVYLAALGGDKGTANEGLNNLRKMETTPETVLFYEELVDLMEKRPADVLTTNISDPTLKTLVQSLRPKAAQ